MAGNFIANSMRRFGLAPKNKVTPTTAVGGARSGMGQYQAPLSHMEVGSPYAYATLQYPMDIQSRTDMGHYMMFYVNVPANTKYARTGKLGEMQKKTNVDTSVETAKDDLGKTTDAQTAILDGQEYHQGTTGDVGSYDETGRSWKPGVTNKVIYRKPHKALLEPPRKRTSDAIVLYMPKEIQSAYAASYKESEVGGTIGEGASRIKDLAAKYSRAEGLEKGNINAAIRGFADMAKDTAINLGLKMAGAALGGDLVGAKDKISNQAQNPFIETMFSGMPFRKFAWSWKFTPKNPKEVEEVYNIIKTFKFHMLPEFPSDNRFGRYFVVPAEFDIFYMFRGEENQWINKIARCVLASMSINYAPTAYQTFRPIENVDNLSGAPPTEIDMNLNFTETSLITKEDIKEGF